MNKFNQFGLKPPARGFEGDKLKISKILNREIVVHDFRIEDSKIDAFRKQGSGKCLILQISFNGEKHILFTSGSSLIDVIQQIPETGFPFTTTIIQDNDRFNFT